MPTLTLKELNGLTEQERLERIRNFYIECVELGESDAVDAVRRRLAKYEHRYECRSEDVSRLINEGKMRETSEVCSWLMDWHLLRRVDDTRNQTA